VIGASALGSGCWPCGATSLSVIATAASAQPNTMTLRLVIALGPWGPTTFLERRYSSAVP